MRGKITPARKISVIPLEIYRSVDDVGCGRNFEHFLNQTSRHDKLFWCSYLKSKNISHLHFFLTARRMKIKILLFLVFCAGFCYSQEAGAGPKVLKRQGRVLFATTTSTTTTVSTYALCWKASVAAQTGIYGCKKKRSLGKNLLNSFPASKSDAALLAPTKSISDLDVSLDEVTKKVDIRK